MRAVARGLLGSEQLEFGPMAMVAVLETIVPWVRTTTGTQHPEGAPGGTVKAI